LLGRVTGVLLALVVTRSHVRAQPPPPRDIQQWTQLAVAYPATPRLTLAAFGELRVGNDVSQLDQELLNAELTYSPSSRVSLGTGYRYIHANPTLSGLDDENRLYADATVKASAFHGFVISDRVRLDLRWLQEPNRATFDRRYRNRLTVERSVDVRAKTQTPFVMWERFYDATLEAWSRTRYYAGLTVPGAAGRSLQLYLMHEANRFSPPFDKTVIGASVMFQLKGAHVRHPGE
jgi:hypothetical protein